MAGYIKPKVRLHKEFLYLNHDTVLNSLSALEAGKVDEIIEKISEVHERGIDASIGAGANRLRGKKGRVTNMEEELKRTRTHFSAFEEWFQFLDRSDAIGRFETWNIDTRNEISVGDTIQFTARVRISPIQQVLLTFISFAREAENPISGLNQTGEELETTRKNTQLMTNLMRGNGDSLTYMVYLLANGVEEPRISARLDDNYLIGGSQGIDGEYTIIGQIESLIQENAPVPALRFLRGAPPSQIETNAITAVLPMFTEVGEQQGFTISESDMSMEYPGVLVHPIAIYR